MLANKINHLYNMVAVLVLLNLDTATIRAKLTN